MITDRARSEYVVVSVPSLIRVTVDVPPSGTVTNRLTLTSIWLPDVVYLLDAGILVPSTAIEKPEFCPPAPKVKALASTR